MHTRPVPQNDSIHTSTIMTDSPEHLRNDIFDGKIPTFHLLGTLLPIMHKESTIKFIRNCIRIKRIYVVDLVTFLRNKYVTVEGVKIGSRI